MVFQREEFCFCNSPIVEMPFSGRVDITPFLPSFLRDSVHSQCLTCLLYLEVRVKEMEMAYFLHSHLICRSLCNHRNGIHIFSLCNLYYWPFLAPEQNSSIFCTLKDWIFRWTLEQEAGSAGIVCEKNIKILGYCRPISESAKTPELVHSSTGIIHLFIKHRIVTFSQKYISSKQ